MPRQLTFIRARTFNAALGLGQSGLQLVERWQTHLLQIATGLMGAADCAPLSVSVDGGPTVALPIARRFGRLFTRLDSDGLLTAVARLSSEKRYGGGQANSLYIFDLKTYATKRITEGPRATRDPIWMGNTIYFNSDRDGHFNLYAFDVPTGKTTQISA